MLLRLLETRPDDIAAVAFFASGWDWQAALDVVARFDNVITVRPPTPFNTLLKRYGWPTPWTLYCRSIKVSALNRAYRRFPGTTLTIGISADEKRRMKPDDRPTWYPLVEWDMSGPDCLAYCRERGFEFKIYDRLPRVSCFCCPLQGVSGLRNVYTHFPKAWQKMLDMSDSWFMGKRTLQDFDEQFSKERWLE